METDKRFQLPHGTVEATNQIASLVGDEMSKLRVNIAVKVKGCPCGCRLLLFFRAGSVPPPLRLLRRIASKYGLAFQPDASQGCPVCGDAAKSTADRDLYYVGEKLVIRRQPPAAILNRPSDES